MRGNFRLTLPGAADDHLHLVKVAPAQGIDNDPRVALANAKNKLDPTKVWNDAFAKGGVDQGLVIATADFLFESGEFKHAAEFLKANLRQGVVVRPWVFEALAVSSGFGPPAVNFVGFGLNLLDLENDGDLDAFIANGKRRTTPIAMMML